MDETFFLANGWLSLLAGLGLSYVVLSQRIHEGFVIKAGLVAMILGLFGTAVLTLGGFDSLRGLLNAGLLLRGGLCVVIAGYGMRCAVRGHPNQRAADWCATHAVDDSDYVHIVGGKK